MNIVYYKILFLFLHDISPDIYWIFQRKKQVKRTEKEEKADKRKTT